MISNRGVKLSDTVVCLDFFVAINFILTKSSMHFPTCLFRAVASIRQDEAIASS